MFGSISMNSIHLNCEQCRCITYIGYAISIQVAREHSRLSRSRADKSITIGNDWRISWHIISATCEMEYIPIGIRIDIRLHSCEIKRIFYGTTILLTCTIYTYIIVGRKTSRCTKHTCHQ